MNLTTIALCLFSLVAGSIAQTPGFDAVLTPTAWQQLSAGQTFTITWNAPAQYSGQRITISLIGGTSQGSQVPIQDIATGVSNDAEAYDWTVDTTLGSANVYGLVFKLESDPNIFQYSNPFKIERASGGRPTSTTSHSDKKSIDYTSTTTPVSGINTAEWTSSLYFTAVSSKATIDAASCNTGVSTATSRVMYTTVPHGHNNTGTAGPLPVPTTVQTSPIASPPVIVTAGADHLSASLPILGGLLIAGLVL
ncbi:hypothetical protein NM208_g3437 [Fusarium decemcellulare]|uniref:Uncharacterized protein n=1 Tax=Fusarium decemcellulare TaxID=57161 RepID=A0ACC1SP34_9HYPO|nr:hypothetical protein NM208_g3437 [Fusarium decemcellulare]